MKAAEAKERLEIAVTDMVAAQKIEAGGEAGEEMTLSTSFSSRSGRQDRISFPPRRLQ